MVEVTLAIGVVAFAFVALVGLLPVGLQTFRRAVDASVGAQIAQRIVNDVQQTDFDVLVGGNTGMFLWRAAPQYFDDQGTEVTAASSAIYHVKTWITPATVLPSTSASPPPEASNASLATVTIQIVSNPGNRTIRTDPVTGKWADSSFPMSSIEAFVARNR